MNGTHYFDYTATTPMTPDALDEYVSVAKAFAGNPSSTHSMGRASSSKLESCRLSVAGCLGVPSSEVFFTSGGTEADSIVLQSLLLSPAPGEVIVTGIEHSAILEHKSVFESHGWKFTVLDCPGGYLDPCTLENALNPKVRMVCIMKVNNVTGTVADLGRLCSVVRRYSAGNGRPIHIHTDAVQALAHIPFSPASEDVDSAAFSAHKFGGPRGVGILWCRSKAVRPLSRGGGQEKGLRGGTENLPAIAAMNVALVNALAEMPAVSENARLCRNLVEQTAKRLGLTLLSPSSSCDEKNYSPFIINISTNGIPSEVFLRMMDDKGFCLSAGSACSANSRGKAEGVLSAMRFAPSQRMSSIRISFGRETTLEETQLLCKALEEAVGAFK